MEKIIKLGDPKIPVPNILNSEGKLIHPNYYWRQANPLFHFHPVFERIWASMVLAFCSQRYGANGVVHPEAPDGKKATYTLNTIWNILEDWDTCAETVNSLYVTHSLYDKNGHTWYKDLSEARGIVDEWWEEQETEDVYLTLPELREWMLYYIRKQENFGKPTPIIKFPFCKKPEKSV